LKYTHSLSILLLLPIVAASALAQSTAQSVMVVKGVVSKVENVELVSDDKTGEGAVVGGVIGYNSGSGRTQSEKRLAAVVGAGLGASAGSSKETPAVRYTIATADGSSVAVVSDVLTIEVGSCVSAEQSADRGTIRKVDQAVCDLEAQTTVAGSRQQPSAEADNCRVAEQQLLDATTAEEVEMASSKIKILCE